MNQTIRELFVKAGGVVEVCDVTQDEVLTYSENCDPEVFAKLIVKECCEVAHCNFHVDGLTLGDILKEHFGV